MANKSVNPELSRVLGRLYKDQRGRRCYLVALNPGQVGFFIEGQPVRYIWFPEETFRTQFTPYRPPVDNTPEPAWWRRSWIQPVICTQPNRYVRVGPASWNGWHFVEIGKVANSRGYIMPMKAIVKHFTGSLDLNSPPVSRLDRLLYQPSLV